MSNEPDTAPNIVKDLFGWYSITMLALGARTGLLEALLADEGSAEEISQRAGTDVRTTREWLRALTGAGHVEHDRGRFHITDHARAVLGPQFPTDFRAVLGFVDAIPTVMDDIAASVASGAGVPAAAYARAFPPRIGRMNTPTYEAALVDDWIAGLDGVAEVLSRGGALADLACGNGDAVALAGRAFPQAHVVGFDVVLPPEGRPDLPANAELRVAAAEQLPREQTFDLVMSLDAFHHVGDARKAAREVHDVLRPGGTFMVVEPGMTGDLDADAADPFSVVVYASSLLWCLQENLAEGGEGHVSDGPAWVVDALVEAGFRDIGVRPSDTGYNIITGVA